MLEYSDPTQVSRLIGSTAAPSMSKLLATADFLGLSADWLLGRVPENADWWSPQLDDARRTLREQLLSRKTPNPDSFALRFKDAWVLFVGRYPAFAGSAAVRHAIGADPADITAAVAKGDGPQGAVIRTIAVLLEIPERWFYTGAPEELIPPDLGLYRYELQRLARAGVRPGHLRRMSDQIIRLAMADPEHAD